MVEETGRGSIDAMNVVIRPGVNDDVPELHRLAFDAYRQYVAAEGSEPAPMMADYGALVAQGHAWVAEENNRVIGLLILEHAGDHLLLENIAVAADVRGLGVGRRLMSFAEERARDLGLSEIRLYTGQVMTQNLHYYPRHGYRETHRGYEDGHHRVYFSKLLS